MFSQSNGQDDKFKQQLREVIKEHDEKFNDMAVAKQLEKFIQFYNMYSFPHLKKDVMDENTFKLHKMVIYQFQSLTQSCLKQLEKSCGIDDESVRELTGEKISHILDAMENRLKDSNNEPSLHSHEQLFRLITQLYRIQPEMAHLLSEDAPWDKSKQKSYGKFLLKIQRIEKTLFDMLGKKPNRQIRDDTSTFISNPIGIDEKNFLDVAIAHGQIQTLGFYNKTMKLDVTQKHLIIAITNGQVKSLKWLFDKYKGILTTLGDLSPIIKAACNHPNYKIIKTLHKHLRLNNNGNIYIVRSLVADNPLLVQMLHKRIIRNQIDDTEDLIEYITVSSEQAYTVKLKLPNAQLLAAFEELLLDDPKNKAVKLASAIRSIYRKCPVVHEPLYNKLIEIYEQRAMEAEDNNILMSYEKFLSGIKDDIFYFAEFCQRINKHEYAYHLYKRMLGRVKPACIKGSALEELAALREFACQVTEMFLTGEPKRIDNIEVDNIEKGIIFFEWIANKLPSDNSYYIKHIRMILAGLEKKPLQVEMDENQTHGKQLRWPVATLERFLNNFIVKDSGDGLGFGSSVSYTIPNALALEEITNQIQLFLNKIKNDGFVLDNESKYFVDIVIEKYISVCKDEERYQFADLYHKLDMYRKAYDILQPLLLYSTFPKYAIKMINMLLDDHSSDLSALDIGIKSVLYFNTHVSRGVSKGSQYEPLLGLIRLKLAGIQDISSMKNDENVDESHQDLLWPAENLKAFIKHFHGIENITAQNEIQNQALLLAEKNDKLLAKAKELKQKKKMYKMRVRLFDSADQADIASSIGENVTLSDDFNNMIKYHRSK